MNEFLKNLIAGYKEKEVKLSRSLVEAETKEEREAINESLVNLRKEMNEAIAKLEEDQKLDIKKTRGANTDEDVLGTMEYRTAFMKYAQTGVRSEILKRAEAGVADDLGVLLPSTIVQQVQTELEGKVGTIYDKVRKTNVKGGVKYPIGAFSATFKRITETTVSDRQKAGGITGYVEFSYNIGEIRIAQTLLQSVLSVPAFEAEVAKVIVKAYLQAMDYEILNGDPSKNEMEGILNGGLARIPEANVITFGDDEISDWTKWEEKFFAEIPMALEDAAAEFVMAKQTYVANLCTMNDGTGQPIRKAGFDVTDRMHKFNEVPVHRVEKSLFKDFNSCSDGEYFGMYWIPQEAYAINSNMEFYVKRYFDEETNQWVDKALVINDGKVLNGEYIYLFKKGNPIT